MAYTADRNIYLNADRSKVVEEDSPDAAFLLVAEGSELSDEEAAEYGLKSSRKAEDKQADASEDKSASKSRKK